jgi:cell division protein FtsW (lipid II flippase)
MQGYMVFLLILLIGSIVGLVIVSATPLAQNKVLEQREYLLNVLIPSFVLLFVILISAWCLDIDDDLYMYPTLVLSAGGILYAIMVMITSYASIVWRAD